MPRLEQWEIKKYWEIFRGLKPEANRLDGEKLGPIFKNSQLPQDKLTAIWDLADIDADGKLDFEEFCIAMRLIFDLVNSNIAEVPHVLPSWLVPGSKRHLVEADGDVQAGTVSGGSGSGAHGDSSDTDDEYSLSSDFDWYISPGDKATYEDMYGKSCDKYGRVAFEAMDALYKSLSIPQTDVSYAWNIVNPKQSETIDKDQCLVFLHILNQRSRGKRIPRSVPASLRATFSKETPEFDLDSRQTQINGSQATEDTSVSAFAQKPQQDYSTNKDKQWTEVDLRRELAQLEAQVEAAQSAKAQKGNDPHLELVRYEMEQLLKYKEGQLEQVAQQSNTGDVRGVRRNIDTIETQAAQLEDFLSTKQAELQALNRKLEALGGSVYV